MLLESNNFPVLTTNTFGKGKGIYLSTFETNTVNNRLLFNILLYAAGIDQASPYITSNPNTECAYFPSSKKLIVINNSSEEQSTELNTASDVIKFDHIPPFETVIKQL